MWFCLTSQTCYDTLFLIFCMFLHNRAVCAAPSVKITHCTCRFYCSPCPPHQRRCSCSSTAPLWRPRQPCCLPAMSFTEKIRSAICWPIKTWGRNLTAGHGVHPAWRLYRNKTTQQTPALTRSHCHTHTRAQHRHAVLPSFSPVTAGFPEVV